MRSSILVVGPDNLSFHSRQAMREEARFFNAEMFLTRTAAWCDAFKLLQCIIRKE